MSDFDPGDRRAISEGEMFRRYGIVPKGRCLCHNCGRGVGNHSITICHRCKPRLERDLARMGFATS